MEVNPATGDPGERMYINVVEEMAIASGVPVPGIYIMPDESTINAFAAGYSPNEAVVAVTRGCIEKLSRDELQGVVAHEFSHILNGDMRLNIRLMGVLFSILFLAIAGYVLLRIGASGARARNKESAGVAAAGVVFGLGLILIGSIGHFFASLIKAAVSRQREFLADSSAVQFTRNPEGIGGALRKIGGLGDEVMENGKAQEISHMCFSNIASGFFSFSTHPPLAERIARIEAIPLEAIATGEGTGGRALPGGAAGIAGDSAPPAKAPREKKVVRARPSDVLDSAGVVSAAGLENAAKIVAGIPAELSEAVRHPFTAMALAYLLVLPAEKGERRKLIKSSLRKIISPAELHEVGRLEPQMPELDPLYRLSLLEMAAPALRLLTRAQAKEFLGRIEAIVHADKQVDFSEFCFLMVVEFCVHGAGRLRRKIRKRYKRISKLKPDFSLILSSLAKAGEEEEEKRQAAFEKAREDLAGSLDVEYDPGMVAGEELKRSIGRLSRSSASIRKQLLSACSECVLADGVVEVKEAELLRAFAHAIDVPLPPFMEAPEGD
jgi:Zn-dependent protease with chaperone function/uncharacterized tellurite resistance protein B-like protein